MLSEVNKDNPIFVSFLLYFVQPPRLFWPPHLLIFQNPWSPPPRLFWPPPPPVYYEPESKLFFLCGLIVIMSGWDLGGRQPIFVSNVNKNSERSFSMSLYRISVALSFHYLIKIRLEIGTAACTKRSFCHIHFYFSSSQDGDRIRGLYWKRGFGRARPRKIEWILALNWMENVPVLD